MFGAHRGHILSIPKVFAEIRQSPNKGVVTVAFLPGWSLEPRSLLSAAAQSCFPRSADFTCFQTGNAYLKHSVLANGKHPFALGAVGMNCQSAYLLSEAFICNYQILLLSNFNSRAELKSVWVVCVRMHVSILLCVCVLYGKRKGQ